MPCVLCHLEIDRDAPARYDVLGVERAPSGEYPLPNGPYCLECWPTTVTGAAQSSNGV